VCPSSLLQPPPPAPSATRQAFTELGPPLIGGYPFIVDEEGVQRLEALIQTRRRPPVCANGYWIAKAGFPLWNRFPLPLKADCADWLGSKRLPCFTLRRTARILK